MATFAEWTPSTRMRPVQRLLPNGGLRPARRTLVGHVQPDPGRARSFMGACHEVDVATLPSGRTRTRRTRPSELFAFVGHLRRLADDAALDDADRARRMRDRFADYVHSKGPFHPSSACFIASGPVGCGRTPRRGNSGVCRSTGGRVPRVPLAGRSRWMPALSRRSAGSSVSPVLVPLTVGGYGVSRLKYWLALFGANACPNNAVASSPALSSPM